MSTASGIELLHRVRGSVDVARSIVGRSTDLYGRPGDPLEPVVLAGLIDAADALSAVADALEEQLRKHPLGPAA